MKKYLKFSGLCAAVLALVAFILMMACPSIVYDGKDTAFEGMTAIFGKKGETIVSFGDFSLKGGEVKLAWTGLLAWIFVISALVILIAGVVLPLLKVKKIEKFAGVLNLVAVGLLVVAGVFMFLTCSVFFAANGYDSVPNKYSLGAGWIIAGILAIVAGAVAILPAAVDFVGKKK